MTLNLRSLTPQHNDEAAYSRGHSLLSRRSPLRERAFNRAIETPRPALNSVGCLRLRRDGVNGRRAPRSSLFPHTTVGSAQRHIRLITQHRETSMARRLVEREARSGCQPARQHPPVQDLHEFAATASPRRATRCDARVPEQPPVLRQRIQKTRARPLISAALPEAVTTTHPRPQSRAKPRVTPLVTISDWRYFCAGTMSQLPRYGPAACPSKDLVFGSTGRPPGCPG